MESERPAVVSRSNHYGMAEHSGAFDSTKEPSFLYSHLAQHSAAHPLTSPVNTLPPNLVFEFGKLFAHRSRLPLTDWLGAHAPTGRYLL
jgi:hypothetical protein